MILCIENCDNAGYSLFSWFCLNPWHVPLCFISLISRVSRKLLLSRNTKIAKIWFCETREVRESFAKHGSIFASFVFRENPEMSFVKNPRPVVPFPAKVCPERLHTKSVRSGAFYKCRLFSLAMTLSYGVAKVPSMPWAIMLWSDNVTER